MNYANANADRSTLFEENATSLTEAAIGVPRLQVESAAENAPDSLAEEEEILSRVNVTELVMAASFNEVALPRGFERAHERALIAADRTGEWSTTNGSGRVTEFNGFKFVNGKLVDGDEDDEKAEEIAEAVERFDREAERRREREEWAQTRHSYFGADLTGDEWGELADAIGKGGKLRQRLIDRLKAQGKTTDEAEKKADQMAEVYRILTKPESQWTEAERAKVEAAKRDPDYEKNAQWLADARQGTAYGAANQIENRSTAAGQQVSVEARADVLDAPPFPNAPDLQENYQAALAAKTPLDAEKPIRIATSNVPSVMPAASGGFDV